jgi:uncharacterized protein (TIGR02996 family)
MTNEPSLLAAVLAEPDSDTPRLVLADWCDDNGRGERAGLIRWHCRPENRETWWPVAAGSAGLWFPDPAEPGPEFRGLRFPVPPLPIAVGHAMLDRGFYRSVECPAADWLAHGDGITAAHPVRAVTLTTPVAIGWRPGDYERCEYTVVANGLGERGHFTVPDGIDGAPGRHEADANPTLALRWRWPRITFTLPPAPATPAAPGGSWRIEIRPRIVWADDHRLPGVAEGLLTGTIPTDNPPRGGDIIGPLEARARDGRVYHVLRAVVTEVHVQIRTQGPDAARVEAVTMGAFRVVTFEPTPARSPFVTLEPRA